MPELVLCSVCLSGLAERDHGGIVSTPCGHLFHKNCIKQWFLHKNDPRPTPGAEHDALEREKRPCPVCRTGVRFKQCIAIYLNLALADDDQTGRRRRYLNSVKEELERLLPKEKQLEEFCKEVEQVKTKFYEEMHIAQEMATFLALLNALGH